MHDPNFVVVWSTLVDEAVGWSGRSSRMADLAMV